MDRLPCADVAEFILSVAALTGQRGGRTHGVRVECAYAFLGPVLECITRGRGLSDLCHL